MAPRAKEPLPPDHGKLQSEVLAERIQSDLQAVTAKLAEMEGRLSAVALDSLAEPEAFDKLESQLVSDRKRARHLAAALTEAEKRIALELAAERAKNQRARIDRVLKHLSARDEIGAEVERLSIELAAKFKALVVAGDKARNSASGLLPDSPGFLTGAGELERLLSEEFWRVSAADIGELITGRPGAIKVPPSLPGSQPIMRIGSPTPYAPADAPSLTARLKEATQFAADILEGKRTYAGPPAATPPPSEWIWPGRDPQALEAMVARERGVLPAPRTAPTEDGGIVAAAKRLVEAVTGHGAAPVRTASPQPMPGEDEIAFAKRLAATPIEPLSAAEREAMNRPQGPKVSSAEAMAIATGGARASAPYDETIGRAKKEEW